MRILVTGSTGLLGSAVIEALLKSVAASQIAVLARKEEKRLAFEERGFLAYLGDYDNIPSLEAAMQGVDVVLLISTGNEGDALQQHKNVVDAAKKVGVPAIAYTSRALRDIAHLSNALMFKHFQTEDYIKASGLKYTIFRNSLYMDAVPIFIGKQAPETGIFQPAGDGAVAYALRQEQGEAMANVLANEPCENKTYLFTGNAAYSFYDVATALTELSGKTVTYTPIELAAFEETMKARGLPAGLITMMVGFNTDIKNGHESEVTDDLARKLGRKPTSLKEGLKVLFGL